MEKKIDVRKIKTITRRKCKKERKAEKTVRKKKERNRI